MSTMQNKDFNQKHYLLHVATACLTLQAHMQGPWSLSEYFQLL